MAFDLKGQRPIPADFVADVPVPYGGVNHLVGTTLTKLVKPEGRTMLVLLCEVVGFRVSAGDRTATGSNDMPAAAAQPAASVTDGSGTWFMGAGDKLVISMPGVTETAFTARGSAASSVLTYYWV